MKTGDLPDGLRALYPFASHRCTQPAGRQHYLDEGSGEAVIMVHGNPTWSFYYREVIKYLQPRGFRCLVPDHLGCGLSDKPQNWSYRLEDHIGNLERWVEELGLERYHLIVHDWGGAIGMGLATRQPQRIGKIVVLNTAAFRGPKIPRRIALCRFPYLGEWIVRRLNAFAGPATFMTTTKPLSPEVKSGYLWPYRTWYDRIAIARFVQDIPMERNHPSATTLDAVDQGLSQLKTCPMLIAWGGRDWCFHDWYFQEWQKRFPDAETLRYPDAGHYVLEDAGDDLLPQLFRFLQA